MTKIILLDNIEKPARDIIISKAVFGTEAGNEY